MRAYVMMLLAVLLVCVPRTAAAQATRSWEVSAGYSFLRDPTSEVSFPSGWTVGAARKLNGWCSAVAEIDRSRKTIPTIIGDVSLSVRTIMVGARASARIGPFIEFGQALAGVVYGSGTTFGVTTSSKNFGGQVGLGLDRALAGRLAARGEVDFRLISGGADTALRGQVRAVASLVYAAF